MAVGDFRASGMTSVAVAYLGQTHWIGAERMEGNQQGIDTRKPVRAGDVFAYDATGRVATVMRTLPGGGAEIRIEGFVDGRKSLRIGGAKVRDLKQWKRLGRAEFLDGTYLSATHLAQDHKESQQ